MYYDKKISLKAHVLIKHIISDGSRSPSPPRQMYRSPSLGDILKSDIKKAFSRISEQSAVL